MLYAFSDELYAFGNALCVLSLYSTQALGLSAAVARQEEEAARKEGDLARLAERRREKAAQLEEARERATERRWPAFFVFASFFSSFFSVF
jgi:hypothetical protein